MRTVFRGSYIKMNGIFGISMIKTWEKMRKPEDFKLLSGTVHPRDTLLVMPIVLGSVRDCHSLVTWQGAGSVILLQVSKIKYWNQWRFAGNDRVDHAIKAVRLTPYQIVFIKSECESFPWEWQDPIAAVSNFFGFIPHVTLTQLSIHHRPVFLMRPPGSISILLCIASVITVKPVIGRFGDRR